MRRGTDAARVLQLVCLYFDQVDEMPDKAEQKETRRDCRRMSLPLPSFLSVEYASARHIVLLYQMPHSPAHKLLLVLRE